MINYDILKSLPITGIQGRAAHVLKSIFFSKALWHIGFGKSGNSTNSTLAYNSLGEMEDLPGGMIKEMAATNFKTDEGLNYFIRPAKYLNSKNSIK